MRQSRRSALAGVTLTELLVVMVIIGLLATLALPVAVSRANQSKYGVARAEVEALAKSEDLVGATHGYYVPLQVLDDIIEDDSTSSTRFDSIGNEPTSIQLIDVAINPQEQLGQQTDLGDTADTRVRDLLREWQGPFAQFQRVYIAGLNSPGGGPPSGNLGPDQVRRDYPLDPWGRAYRFYSPLGIIGSTVGTTAGGSPATDSDMNSDSFSNGNLTTTDPRFDRYAIVSFGPDGTSDETDTSGGGAGNPIVGDDIIYLFGTVPRLTDTVIP